MSDKTETRQQILDAAMQRIMHYGYAKTTMAEIARDCDMSAGNIYRFFASKIDIAEAMARKINMEIKSSTLIEHQKINHILGASILFSSTV